MEIPQEVQQKLKCSECDELLSCGPVYLLHESGGAICGRCCPKPAEKDSSNGRTRNDLYEATASLLAFPCVFAARGCPEKLIFSLRQPLHEIDCEFCPFICPIAPRGSCDWFGSWPTLKEHWDENHPSNIFENLSNPPLPDLTTSNLQTYVISAFRFLFLLHIKVCVTSGKLFHSVKMFGNSKLDNFSYSLEIEENDSIVKKQGSVLHAGILMLQEPTANFILINNLMDILGGKYNESIFTITIIRKCLNCLKNIDSDSEYEFCDDCQAKLIKCLFNRRGCSFVDVINEKCKKHEFMFCKYDTKCFECGENFVGGTLIEHLGSSASCLETIRSNINSVVRVTPCSSRPKYILFSSNNIGTVIGYYYLFNSEFYFRLDTSLYSYELKNYKCLIELTDPQTKHTQHLTPQNLYMKLEDWEINEQIENFPSCKTIGIDLKVNIFINKNVLID